MEKQPRKEPNKDDNKHHHKRLPQRSNICPLLQKSSPRHLTNPLKEFWKRSKSVENLFLNLHFSNPSWVSHFLILTCFLICKFIVLFSWFVSYLSKSSLFFFSHFLFPFLFSCSSVRFFSLFSFLSSSIFFWLNIEIIQRSHDPIIEIVSFPFFLVSYFLSFFLSFLIFSILFFFPLLIQQRYH